MTEGGLMRVAKGLGLPLALLLAIGIPAPAAARDEAAPGYDIRPPASALPPTVTRLICTPKALGLVCSTTNIRALVTAGDGGRSQTLTAAPYQPYVPPRGRALTGFDVDLTVYASRSVGGRIFLMVDVGGDPQVFDLTDRVEPGRGGIRTLSFSTERALIAEGSGEGLRLPIHLLLTAQTRGSADTARLDVIEIEMRPRSGL
jgi:hypothetical protein